MKRPFIIAIAVVLLLVAAGYFVLREDLRNDPRTNISYICWKNGLVGYDVQYHFLFTKDAAFQNALKGKPVAAIEGLFPSSHTGSDYTPDSYRGEFLDLANQDAPEYDYFWLEFGEDDFGLCAVIKDGVVSHFQLVKG